jgi:putative oxidoreductase
VSGNGAEGKRNGTERSAALAGKPVQTQRRVMKRLKRNKAKRMNTAARTAGNYQGLISQLKKRHSMQNEMTLMEGGFFAWLRSKAQIFNYLLVVKNSIKGYKSIKQNIFNNDTFKKTLIMLKNDDLGKLFLRIAVAVIILFHGWFKLMHGIAWIQGMLGRMGFLAYAVYLAELVAPLMILVGFRTRFAALLLAVDMLVAILMVLHGAIFTVKEMGGGWAIETEAMLLIGSLALIFTGAGKFAISSSVRWD